MYWAAKGTHSPLEDVVGEEREGRVVQLVDVRGQLSRRGPPSTPPHASLWLSERLLLQYTELIDEKKQSNRRRIALTISFSEENKGSEKD